MTRLPLRVLYWMAPFLMAIFTVITLFTANVERIDPGQMIPPLIFSLGVAGILTLLFWLLRWTAPAAPFVAAIFAGALLLWYQFPWWGNLAIMAAAIGMSLQWHDRKLTRLVGILFSAILLCSIVFTGIQGGIVQAGKDPVSAASGPTGINPNQANLYFIIPDRMPSAAAMRESGINPDQALADLRSLGFQINEDQRSADGYTWDWPERIHSTRTMRYLASLLNGGVSIPMDIPYRECRRMIQDNAVFTWLHGKGYTIAVVPSWFVETQAFSDQDEIYPFTDVGLLERVLTTELGEAYFERTILNGLNLRIMESWGSQVRVEKARHQWQAGKIITLATSGRSSLFVFAHLTLPHEPYVYGDPADPVQDQYAANVQFALRYLVDLATAIRAADPGATILIQSDEGMAYSRPAEANYSLSQRQWSGTFNAWYWPDDPGNCLNCVAHTDILGLVVQSR